MVQRVSTPNSPSESEPSDKTEQVAPESTKTGVALSWTVSSMRDLVLDSAVSCSFKWIAVISDSSLSPWTCGGLIYSTFSPEFRSSVELFDKVSCKTDAWGVPSVTSSSSETSAWSAGTTPRLLLTLSKLIVPFGVSSASNFAFHKESSQHV